MEFIKHMRWFVINSCNSDVCGKGSQLTNVNKTIIIKWSTHELIVSIKLKSENPSTFWTENLNHFQYKMREYIKLSMPKELDFFKTNQPLGGEAIPSNQAEGKVNLTGHLFMKPSNFF